MGGITKKARELATLTGSHVILVVADTDRKKVQTYASPKLEALERDPEWRQLVMAHINAPPVVVAQNASAAAAAAGTSFLLPPLRLLSLPCPPLLPVSRRPLPPLPPPSPSLLSPLILGSASFTMEDRAQPPLEEDDAYDNDNDDDDDDSTDDNTSVHLGD